MRKEINIPKLGSEMQEALITEWLVKVGDEVDVGTPLCNIEAEKMEAEVEALYRGTVAEITGGEGDTYDVGAVIGYIDAD